MKNDRLKISVYENFFSDKNILMGHLYSDTINGKNVFSFEFDKTYLNNNNKYFLDDELQYVEGRQYPYKKELFGLFEDSLPDRWGRVLLNKKELELSRIEGRPQKHLMTTDYLLGIDDRTRMGAIRFSLDEGKTFESNDINMPVPAIDRLRDIEEASIAYENNEDIDLWIKKLVAPGSSLGGSRPKANVIDTNGDLYIAKFPSVKDEYDVGKKEKQIYDLARRLGLNVVNDTKLMKLSNFGSTFLIKRFDREHLSGKYKRIHFASCMNLLGKTDGEDAKDSSYIDIAQFIKSNGAFVKEDLKELFVRIAFNIKVHNTDDHLRNHGFILTKNGWKLSPLYDVNESLYGDCLSIKIDDKNYDMDYELLLSTCKYYDIDYSFAKELIELVKNADYDKN